MLNHYWLALVVLAMAPFFPMMSRTVRAARGIHHTGKWVRVKDHRPPPKHRNPVPAGKHHAVIW